MTLRELRNQTKRMNIPDLWWLAIDGKVQDARIRLVDLQMRQNRLMNRQVQLLNAYSSNQDEWLDIDFSTALNLDNNPHMQDSYHSLGMEQATQGIPDFLARKERELIEREAKLNQFAEALSQRELAIENDEKQIKARILARKERLLYPSSKQNKSSQVQAKQDNP